MKHIASSVAILLLAPQLIFASNHYFLGPVRSIENPFDYKNKESLEKALKGIEKGYNGGLNSKNADGLRDSITRTKTRGVTHSVEQSPLRLKEIAEIKKLTQGASKISKVKNFFGGAGKVISPAGLLLIGQGVFIDPLVSERNNQERINAKAEIIDIEIDRNIAKLADIRRCLAQNWACTVNGRTYYGADQLEPVRDEIENAIKKQLQEAKSLRNVYTPPLIKTVPHNPKPNF